MKKVGLLTLHPKSYNYGGLLQELALQDVVSSLEMQCEILNYDPTEEINVFSVKRDIGNITINKVMAKLQYFYRKTRHADIVGIVKPLVVIRKKAFDTYRTKQLNLSKPLSYIELHTKRLPYDAIICGSDQIWNPDFCIPAFFLDFVKDDQNKIIYGASIGKGQLSARQLKTYQKLMKGLEHISVREHSAQRILSPITEQPIQVVLDPTLLHSQGYWLEKAESSPKSYTEYVFCYFLDLTEEKVEAARGFAKKHGCKIVAIPYLHGYYEPLCERLADVLDADVNPADFLKLIADARYVLTDSFHAAVFSLIFRKNFWVFGRKAGNYDMNTRLDTLLGYFGAEDRMIIPEDLDKQRDSELVVRDDVLMQMRETSLQFLKDVLK